MRPLIVKAILDRETLVDCLHNRGFDPCRISNNRYLYNCPLHGPEKDPSFYVFSNDEYQYYHCFSCQKHGDLINLVAELDHCSLKDAIRKLSLGLGIKPGDTIENISNEIEASGSVDISLEDISLKISCLFYSYLEFTEFDPEEIEFVESVFKEIDKCIIGMDKTTLIELYDKLSDIGIPLRAEKFKEKKELELNLKNQPC